MQNGSRIQKDTGGVKGAGREAAGGHAGFVPFGDRVLASRDLPVYSEWEPKGKCLC